VSVEAIVKVMETFPKCHDLQASACIVLCNLASCNIGKKKTVESSGLRVLLATINLNSANVCWYVCFILIQGSRGKQGKYQGVDQSRRRHRCFQNQKRMAG
jgi:hypothetical protein